MTWLLRLVPSLVPGLTAFLNPWVLLAVVAAAGGLWIHGYRKGVHATEAENAIARVVVIRKVDQVKELVHVEHVKREVEIVTEFGIIEKEAAHVPSRAHCNVTAGWMLEHDAAAAARRLEGAVDDPADTGIAEARALAEVILPNYRAFHQVANDLKACRAFVDGLAEATR